MIRHLVSAAVAALPLAILAFAGCNGDVLADSTATGACSKSDPCPSGAVCVLPPNACQPDAKGTCPTVFQGDGPPSGPGGGCDGKVVEGDYPDCEPAMAGSSCGDSAACQTGTFACGPTLKCKRNSAVCVEKVPGVPGSSSYECAAFATVNQWCQHEIPACGGLDPSKVGAGMTTLCKADADNQETIPVTAP